MDGFIGFSPLFLDLEFAWPWLFTRDWNATLLVPFIESELLILVCGHSVSNLWGSMALSGVRKDRELRIHESLDELSAVLADYIAEISEAAVKERGVFAMALSGGSLIGLMRYQSFLFPNFWFLLFCDSFVDVLLMVGKQKTVSSSL